MVRVIAIKLREVLDSRGNPTVEAELHSNRFKVFAISPSGASTGKKEAVELRDKDERYHGKGVKKVIERAMEKIKELIGKEFSGIEEFDNELIRLDGTENKSNLGGNVTTALSIAFAKLFAAEHGKKPYQLFSKQTIPIPMLNLINGGKHATNKLSFQEFLVVPRLGCFSESLRASVEIYKTLGNLLGEKRGGIGDEGGYNAFLSTNREALEFLERAIEENGYSGKVKISLDVAANSFSYDSTYDVDGNAMNEEEYFEYLVSLIKEFRIYSVEDPFPEEKPALFEELKKKNLCKVVGDDITVTNAKLIEENAEKIDGVIIKINQIGTVSEAIKAAKTANSKGIFSIISHRSGDSEDNFIAHFAVGNGKFIKTGAPARSERTCKYNTLLRIEECVKEYETLA